MNLISSLCCIIINATSGIHELAFAVVVKISFLAPATLVTWHSHSGNKHCTVVGERLLFGSADTGPAFVHVDTALLAPGVV